MKDIRNDFAHKLRPLDFRSEIVNKKCKKLQILYSKERDMYVDERLENMRECFLINALLIGQLLGFAYVYQKPCTLVPTFKISRP